MHLLDKTCTAYFFDFRADAYIFVICSNSVEQSRFWCRADFLSRWILSRWPFSFSYESAISETNCYSLATTPQKKINWNFEINNFMLGNTKSYIFCLCVETKMLVFTHKNRLSQTNLKLSRFIISLVFNNLNNEFSFVSGFLHHN